MGKDYNISKASGRCLGCDRELQPGEVLVATVRETADDFQREDFCEACWDSRGVEPSAEVFGTWRRRVPRPQEKKRKLFVDDEVLVSFFQRLAGAQEPVKVSFRFVLALILMRKRLLVYDRAEADSDSRDTWLMHLKGDDQTHRVIDPHMDDERIAEVSRHLGDILEAEL